MASDGHDAEQSRGQVPMFTDRQQGTTVLFHVDICQQEQQHRIEFAPTPSAAAADGEAVRHGRLDEENTSSCMGRRVHYRLE